ncbi:MAG: D-alanyl-D-alanine carboxypeptidase [Rhodospirillaceae bacterium]|nr:D-alanyl-D-alanine carboxypeptidase [Rhodospirillaceae bacterium]
MRGTAGGTIKGDNLSRPETRKRKAAVIGYWSRRLLATAFAAVLVALGPQPAFAKYASLVLDAETGRVIHEINADTRNYPASLTKMMTMYLVFEALESKLWTVNSRLRVSARAARQPASRLGLRRGQRITVEDAILALITKSANDAATVIAENMSGSERSFARKMTAKARRLGMNRTTFRNASGLPHRRQLSTARDMGVLARALIRDFPVYYRYFSIERFAYLGITHRNHNRLLSSYDGADGIKTGYIRASGFNLVASAQRHGRRVIGVIFGGNSPNSRNVLMTRLLNLGFKALSRDARPVAAAAPPKPKAVKAKAKPRKEPRTAARGKSLRPVPKHRRWGIQVGAFARYSQAYDAARKAIEVTPRLLRNGTIKVVPLKKRNGRVLHRARIKGISRKQAVLACRFLKKRQARCMEIRMRDGYRVAANDR